MGENYLSYHAGTEGKMKKGDVNGLANHTFRKTNDVYKNHGNEMIKKDMTKYNIDHLKDGKPLNEQIDEQIEMRFRGKRGLNQKSIVAREVIIQPSANHFDGLDIDQQIKMMEKFTEDSMGWLSGEFGEDNILGYSIHMDESNPHVHVPVIPMTKDGRLSQKDFFKGPGHLKSQHKGYREHMNGLGWVFESENKNEGSKGVSLREYKANAKAIEKARKELDEKLELLGDDNALREMAVQGIVADFKSDESSMSIIKNGVKQEIKEEIEREEMPQIRMELNDELSVLQQQVEKEKRELEKKKEEIKAIEKREQLVVANMDKARKMWEKGKSMIAEAKKEMIEAKEMKAESKKGMQYLSLHKRLAVAMRSFCSPAIVDDYLKFMKNTTGRSAMGLKVPVVDEKKLTRTFDDVADSEKKIVRKIIRETVEDDGPDL